MRTFGLCRVAISRSHKVPHGPSQILKDPSNVLYTRTCRRYDHVLKGQYDEEDEGLWLLVTGNHMSKNRTVRNWARRKVENALWDQLNAKGFDRCGRKLTRYQKDESTMEQGHGFSNRGISKEAKPHLRSLVGTVQICVLDNIIHSKQEEVRRQAGIIVEEIFKICGARTKS